ncbi:hypothetical protein GIB67_011690 [Kingdonia uniflora]|uniref:serine--tRNA ligase n=1 Tax=Kingdonia uniflora TaxID=39325 RepID=A0A7J7LUI7_9MAGN|nr:hypothetical protein GIB67_011690 [Kingdonia uniflora]
MAFSSTFQTLKLTVLPTSSSVIFKPSLLLRPPHKTLIFQSRTSQLPLLLTRAFSVSSAPSVQTQEKKVENVAKPQWRAAIDFKWIRDNKDEVAINIKNRNSGADLELVLELYEKSFQLQKLLISGSYSVDPFELAVHIILSPVPITKQILGKELMIISPRGFLMLTVLSVQTRKEKVEKVVKPQWRATIDFKWIRDNKDEVTVNIKNRNSVADLELVLKLYEKLFQLQKEVERIRAERNFVANKMKGKLEISERQKLIEEGKILKEGLTTLEEDLVQLTDKLQQEALSIPNKTHPNVPVGGEECSVLRKMVGNPRDFGFTIKDHLQLGKELDLFDFDSAAEVSGSKFYYLKNEAVMLEMGLTNWAISEVMKRGFTPLTTPEIVRSSIVEKCGFQPRGTNTQVYSIEGSDQCLIGTAEIPVGGIHMDSLLADSVLPLKYVASSHCFRTEAGAAGSATRADMHPGIRQGSQGTEKGAMARVRAWHRTTNNNCTVSPGIGHGKPSGGTSMPLQQFALTMEYGHRNIKREGSWSHNSDLGTPRDLLGIESTPNGGAGMITAGESRIPSGLMADSEGTGAMPKGVIAIDPFPHQWAFWRLQVQRIVFAVGNTMKQHELRDDVLQRPKGILASYGKICGRIPELGLYRVHQFSKVEMFILCRSEDSEAYHEELIQIEEDLFSSLGLHFKTLDMASGDLGSPAYRKFDVEAWMPGLGRYGEISSASNCTDYQSRRLGIRYRPSSLDPSLKSKKSPTQFVHTLNATACAVPRMIVCLLENFQQADGSVIIPEPLRPFMGGLDLISPKSIRR